MFSFRKNFLNHGRIACYLCSSAVVSTSVSNTSNELKLQEAAGKNTESENNNKPEDGWDRLAIMFSKNEFGELSNELSAVINAASLTFLLGSTYGICMHTKEAHKNFIEKNQATQFASAFDAKKKLQDRVMIAAFKGWLQYGVKLSAFSSFMFLGTTSLMVYTGKSSVFHYGLAGTLFGGMYKWKLGPRGMFVGGTVGGILGLIAGVSTSGLLYMFDSSLDDVIASNAEHYKSRQITTNKIYNREIDMESSKTVAKILDEHAVSVNESLKNDKLMSSQ